jgi:hypothetical protein
LARIIGRINTISNTSQQNRMKKFFVPALIGFSAMTLLSGCLGIQIGGGSSSKSQTATVGQQLTDLQHAKDAGAVTDAEYQAQKAKILGNK